VSFSYKIVGFNEQSGSVIVKYHYDGDHIATYNVDIPLDDNGLFIVGEQLDRHISGLFPIGVLDRMSKLKAGISNADQLQALVVTPLPTSTLSGSTTPSGTTA